MALDKSILKRIKSDVTSNSKKYFFTAADGQRYKLDFTGDDEYLTDDFGYKGRKETVAKAVSYVLQTGSMPSNKMLAEILNETRESIAGIDKDDNPYITDKTYSNVTDDIYTFLDKNNISIDTINQSLINAKVERRDADGKVIKTTEPPKVDTKDAKEEAYEQFSPYYGDIYSLAQGTSGRDMYDRLTVAEQNRALSEYNMADAMQQNQAMQQAQTIKAITDQVRAERMSRLRAGMSEAQIANQDMQMMMTNVNALNQQTQEMNMARLQSQYAYGNAQDTAYQQYLEQANARGQIGSAMYAADAGNLNFQVEQSLRKKYPTQSAYTKAQWDAEQKQFTN